MIMKPENNKFQLSDFVVIQRKQKTVNAAAAELCLSSFDEEIPPIREMNTDRETRGSQHRKC